MDYNYFIYIISNKSNRVLYIGVTSDLKKRILEHRNKRYDGFTSRYNVYKLVYYEPFKYIREAILREKQLKKWKRAWKIELIEKLNPGWDDLFNDVSGW